MNIEILDTCNQSDLAEIALVYAASFATNPWNEYTKCSSENKFYGKESNPGEKCISCGEELILAYPKAETMGYINKESQRSDVLMLIARDNSLGIVGFSWGFVYENPNQFAMDKYWDPVMQRKIPELLESEGISSAFFYFAETGIKSEARGNGITNYFYDRRLSAAKEKGLPVAVRTNCLSPIMAVAQTYGFRQIMGPEVEIDRKNLRIEPTGKLINGFEDKEINKRVLFIKKGCPKP